MLKKAKISIRFALLSCLVFCVITVTTESCKKTDSLVADAKKEIIEEKPENFFKLPDNASPVMKRIVKELERQNKTKEFITAFIAKEGFPIWDKSRIERQRKNGHIADFDADGLEDTTVYIPLVVSADHYVTGFLKATVDDSVRIKIFRQSDYVNFAFKTPTTSTSVTTAEQYAIRFMSMDKDVFGSTQFKVNDKRMFNNSTDYSDTADIQRFITLSSGGDDAFANGTTINNYEYEVCWTVDVYRRECGSSFSGSGNNIEGNCHYVLDGQLSYCTSYQTEGGGNGSGTWPFGGGGSNGGSSNVPCTNELGASTNSFVPIECNPTEGNPWPPTTPQSWLDHIWMTSNLKDSTNNPCVAQVLATLRSISSTLPELLRSVFDTAGGTNGFDVTLKMTGLGPFEGGNTTLNFTDFDYKVNINNYFNDATDLSVACTIIHEIFHAQIYAWFRQCYTLNDTAKQRELINKWGYMFTGEFSFDSSLAYIASNPTNQHQAIATRYKDFIGEALFKFAQARGISTTLEYCKYLAWSGCQGSNAFAALGSTAGNAINIMINAEKDPDGYNGLNTSPPQAPVGNRCL